ncbi:MAG: Cof-type HAD-IIB family hydrolase [Clostridium sp.]|nr:Cof-type HAD-IIB family hydrolase [Clostridium sp.]
MAEYKIIFSDIDGTLLTSKHEVSEKTKEALKKLKKVNIPFVLVSARMPKGIYKVQKEIDYDSPIVCYSGGLVIDNLGRSILSNGINLDIAYEVKKYIDSNWKEVSTSCYSDNQWIVDDKENEWIVQESEITSVEPVVGNILDACSNNQVIHKILCMGNPEMIDEIKKSIYQKFTGLSIYKSKETYLEIMADTATKSNAMKVLCDMLNVNINETIAIGDNYNDVDMIVTAGKGIAMGNAPKEVKEKSDYVTLSNDEDGVSAVIEKYFD